MSLIISKDKTPILDQQTEAVQKLCQQAYSEYHGQKSVAIRNAQGRLFDTVRRRSDLNLVDAEGNVTDLKATFSGICDEMNIPRSTAYNYADEYVVTQTYPEPIQAAASNINLNLANGKVQAEYERLKGAGEIPPNLDTLQAEGLVARIKKSLRKKSKARSSKEQKFKDMLEEAFKFAKNEEMEPLVVAKLTASAAQDHITVDDAVKIFQETWINRHANMEESLS